ncbi:hypothetical protein BCR34DRAFT_265664 [Clohesyomyces aquaticus]|uniref:ABM domain-containing protein n=1 Tax=Clohesyomyces aquaticus TaxID=1231657 RepID=A0A1Y1ZTI7_9PLEO|nr:hypothetical protein BCR34DRAFT_265664 [Clohesyomyces aquaticus]
MTITEIALLRLSLNISADDSSLRSKLTHAKDVMEGYTGRRFYYLQQVEDPKLLYIIGEWESLDQHMNGFIPSADNQALLECLKDNLSVEWLHHIDAPHSALPLPTADGEPCFWSIGRHFIKPGQKEKFKETFENTKQHVQDLVTKGTIGGGWRMETEELDEFVLFTPWTDVEQHQAFAKTDGFKEYFKITEYLDHADIKHAKLLEL